MDLQFSYKHFTYALSTIRVGKGKIKLTSY